MAGSPVKAPKSYIATQCGTVFPAGQASILFDIPTELRLEVYKLILEDCLENGFVMDIAGLFYCCRQIHLEIESEFMPAVRPLLTAKNDWELSESYSGVLSMRILPKLTSKKANLFITIPIRPVFDHYTMTEFDKSRVQNASLFLQEVFARAWSTLTISFERGSDPMTMFETDTSYQYFFRGDSRLAKSTFHHIKHIERLELYYDDPSVKLARSAIFYVSMWYLACHTFRHEAAPSLGGRGWLTTEGKQSGWRLIIDLKDDLDPVKGAMIRLTDRDGHTNVKYNPLGDVPVDVLNECYYISDSDYGDDSSGSDDDTEEFSDAGSGGEVGMDSNSSSSSVGNAEGIENGVCLPK